MTSQVSWRKGTTLEHASFTGALGEVTVDTTKKTLVVHDGTTPGGFPIGDAEPDGRTFETRAEAVADSIDAGIHEITLLANETSGDGRGGRFVDADNGANDTFESLDGRTWYSAPDIGLNRITDALFDALSGPVDFKRFTTSNPMVIPHRGSSLLYPEHTKGAYLEAVKSGQRIIEFDVHLLSDGQCAIFHDTTVDRIATSTGNVASLTRASFKALNIDVENWHGGSIDNASRPMMLEEGLDLLQGKVSFSIEAKNTGSGAALVAILDAYRVDRRHVMISSFTQSELTAALAAGYTTAILAPTGTTALAAAQAAGIEWVHVSSAMSDADINTWKAAGFKVVVYTVNRRWRRDELKALGVHGFFTDDAIYFSQDEPVATRDDFRRRTWMPGMLGRADSLSITDRGRFFNDGWGVPIATPAYPDPGTFMLQGWACPVVSDPATQSFVLDMDITYYSGNTGSWCSIFIADSSMADREMVDGDGGATYPSPPTEKGWNILFRANGNIDVYKRNGATATLVNSVTSAAIGAGSTARCRVIVRPSQILAQRISNVGAVLHTNTVNDTQFRGAYFHTGIRAESVWSIKNIRVLSDPAPFIL